VKSGSAASASVGSDPNKSLNGKHIARIHGLWRTFRRDFWGRFVFVSRLPAQLQYRLDANKGPENRL
jgi:hypothetical protein